MIFSVVGWQGCNPEDPGDQRGSGAGSDLRIHKILKNTPMEDSDRTNLLNAVDTAAGKVVNKLILDSGTV